jgi:hypothetical protein
MRNSFSFSVEELTAIAVIFLIGLAAIRFAYTTPTAHVRALLALAFVLGSGLVLLYVLRGF